MAALPIACTFVLVAVAAACSSSDGNAGPTGGGSDASTTLGDAGDDTGGTDVAVDSVEQADQGEPDSAADVDEDAGASDVGEPDAVEADLVGDVDDDAGADATDATTTDISDGGSPDVPTIDPNVCLVDADCPPIGLGPCWSGKCNVDSGACEATSAADGAKCKAAGPCALEGVCKQGVCAAGNACNKQPCVPKPLSCGASLQIDLGASGASKMNAYSCSPWQWTGGETVVALASEVTVAADVILTGADKAGAEIFLIAAGTDTCAPGTCAAHGTKLKFGLGPKVQRLIVIDTKAAATGNVTLTVECQQPTGCGNGICNPGETCGTCPKDCGACACGDGICQAGSEDCSSCGADCGVCLPGCATVSSSPGCGGCECEKCVCDMDSYCCQSAWDSICMSECASAACNGAPCPTGGLCGDDKCSGGEDFSTCPNDCKPAVKCGDGLCVAGEVCTTCPIDCGSCADEGGGTPGGGVCGDDKCEANESCATCAQDCGACDASCQAGGAAGCPGCACETCVCAMDSYCCASAWDSICVNECSQQCEGPVCPVPFCGDGACGGSETCSNCIIDCGACTNGCMAHPAGGCQGCDCESCVIAAKPECANAWTDICVETCAGSCDSCNVTCGNGFCEKGETCAGCPSDCGGCPTGCGDDVCALGETCSGCPMDCGSCYGEAFCGDGSCEMAETKATCPKDCGYCGDGKCDDSESKESCKADCDLGSCDGKCGGSAKNPDGSTCYCDEACTGFGDCCPDYDAYCPGG